MDKLKFHSPRHKSGNVVSGFQHNAVRNKFFLRTRNMLNRQATLDTPYMRSIVDENLSEN